MLGVTGGERLDVVAETRSGRPIQAPQVARWAAAYSTVKLKTQGHGRGVSCSGRVSAAAAGADECFVRRPLVPGGRVAKGFDAGQPDVGDSGAAVAQRGYAGSTGESGLS